LDAPALVACTAQRLKHFVGPLGVRQAWPTVDELPPVHGRHFEELLSDQGVVSDGYMQRLIVDTGSKVAYVVQQGGFAGVQTVYGPLPVGACVAVSR
jgi:hypothetical protein